MKQIFLDTETTGLDYKSGHKLIEIACVEIENRKFTGREYQSYLNPNRAIDPGAVKFMDFRKNFFQTNQISLMFIPICWNSLKGPNF